MRTLAVALSVCLVVSGPARADDAVKGPAQVRDSVTIAVAGSRFRLEGIDVPGNGTCSGKDCAEAAADVIGARITGHDVACTKQQRLGHGYFLARCKLDDGTDIAKISLEEGLSVPQPNAVPGYAEASELAKSQGRGHWSK